MMHLVSKTGFFCCALIGIFWPSDAVAVQQIQESNKLDKSQVELASIVKCSIQNAKGLTSCDVLITKVDIFDNADPREDKGILKRDERVIRIVFDQQTDSFAQYEINSANIIDLASDKENQTFQYVAFSSGGDDEASVFTRFKDRLAIRPRSKFADSTFEFLREVGYPDPRGLMIQGSLGPVERLIRASSETPPSKTDDFRNIESLKRSGNHIVIKQHHKDSGVPGCELLVTETYHIDSLMMVSRKITLFHIEKKLEIPFESIRYVWKDFDGIQLPTNVTSEKHLALNISGRRESGTKTVNIKLNWLSVNKPIPDHFFDGSLLQTDELIRAQLEVEEEKKNN